jgi:hypothetical protein
MVKAKADLKYITDGLNNGGDPEKGVDGARMGSYKLTKIRNQVSKAVWQKLSEGEKQNYQLKLVNDYLNGYSDKLSTSGPNKIKVDQEEFELVANGVLDGSSKPYKDYFKMKKVINKACEK